jgi:hypothetical protein
MEVPAKVNDILQEHSIMANSVTPLYIQQQMEQQFS